MANELKLIEDNVFSLEERNSFEQELDKYISRSKDNRQEINRLVFEAVATMTEADESQAELENKTFLQRLVGGFTGSNKELQDKINKNRAAAQYAAQQTLNKLAEQNMMSFELIAAVNNKINASLNNVNEEFENIYRGLAKFLRRSANALVMVEERLKKLEHNVELGRWKDTIAYRELDDEVYQDLSPAGKIVCIAREFYEKTNGNWSTEDLLYIRSVMTEIGINQKDKVNYYQTLQEISRNKAFRNKLLGDTQTLKNINPEYMISMGVLDKLDNLMTKEKYIVETMSSYLNSKGVDITSQEVCEDLTRKYILDKAGVDLNVDIEAYDMILDLLYNIKNLDGIEDVKKLDSEVSVPMIEATGDLSDFKEAEKLYLQCKFKEAAKKLTKFAENGNTRAMYILGEIYHGLLPKLDCDEELAHYWWYRGAREKDVLCMEKCDYGDSEERKKSLEYMADEGDMYAQYLLGYDLSMTFDGKENGIQLLRMSAEQGYFLAMEQMEYADDEEESKKWLRKAGELGYDGGWYALAYIVGKNNDVEARKYYQLAYDLRGYYSGESAVAIGNVYKEAYEKVKWYEIAVELDSEYALYALAELYSMGYNDGKDRIDKNVSRAIDYYKKCYDKGESLASKSACKIGILYDEEDRVKSRSWFKKSGELGCDWGWYYLGMSYYKEGANYADLAIYSLIKACDLDGEAKDMAAKVIKEIIDPSHLHGTDFIIDIEKGLVDYSLLRNIIKKFLK